MKSFEYLPAPYHAPVLDVDILILKDQAKVLGGLRGGRYELKMSGSGKNRAGKHRSAVLTVAWKINLCI